VFAYISGELADGTTLPLCRLRYNGSASIWGLAIYLASRDGYEDNVLPSGLPVGSTEEALDCACGLYLNDPTAAVLEAVSAVHSSRQVSVPSVWDPSDVARILDAVDRGNLCGKRLRVHFGLF
jgi:hypothetical protein